MIPTVFIVGEGAQIADMFLDEKWSISETLHQADLIQFTGGHDLNPAMYGEKNHDSTWSWPKRDTYESVVYHLARRDGHPMAGICRGAQFLNVMNGGKMWQDVDGHSLTTLHWVDCNIAGDKIGVSSTHHQMMRAGTVSELLMTATCSTYKERMNKKGGVFKVMNDSPDTEALYYKDSGALCFQPHPEYKHLAGISLCRMRYFDYLDHFFDLRA